jgi:hypothetical protein
LATRGAARSTNHRTKAANTADDERAQREFLFFIILINPDFGFWLQKNSYTDGKISRKFMEIALINWNNFRYWKFLQNTTDFELNQRFPSKFKFLKNWSLMKIETTNINPPELKIGQVDLHGGLPQTNSQGQTRYRIPKRAKCHAISGKKNPMRKPESFSSIWTPKNTFRHQEFYIFAYL